MKEVDMAMLVDGVAKVISGAPFPSKQSLSKARQAVEFVLAAPALDLPSIAERDRLRAERKECWEEAVSQARECRRLKALLHDAQRDAERFAWLEKKCHVISTYMEGQHRYTLDGDFHRLRGPTLAAAIDSAMAAELEVSPGEFEIKEGAWVRTSKGERVQIWTITPDDGCYCNDLQYHCASTLRADAEREGQG